MKTFKRGGIHPAGRKDTAGSGLRELPVPKVLRLVLSQSIGAPAKAIVKPDEHVEAGQRIAEAGGFVSVPLHTPYSGTVKKIQPVRDNRGLWREAIEIAVDEDAAAAAPQPRTAEEIAAMSPKELIGEISGAGIVGMGGAAFPTHVKLSVPEGKHADYLLINGAECEPVLTCDDTLMRLHPEKVVEGAMLLQRASGADRCIIGIEENKPEAIRAMRKAVEGKGPEVAVLKKKYPQGGEKQLIQAITGREVPLGGLPIDVGCIVDNVATAAAVYDAVAQCLPLTHRIVTVAGDGLTAPGNFLAPVGVSITELIDAAGGLPEGAEEVISGGPMMGQACSDIDAPTMKATGGILVQRKVNVKDIEDYGPCIRCAKCVSACPMGLEPYLLMALGLHAEWEEMKKRQAMACLQCGCCSYVCPSRRPILDYIKLGKEKIKRL